jgi:hypothetical protein
VGIEQITREDLELRTSNILTSGAFAVVSAFGHVTVAPIARAIVCAVGHVAVSAIARATFGAVTVVGAATPTPMRTFVAPWIPIFRIPMIMPRKEFFVFVGSIFCSCGEEGSTKR